MGQGQPGVTATIIVGSVARTRAIDAATAVNTSDDVATLTVYLVQTGAASAGNAIYSALSLNPGETVVLAGLINQCVQPAATVVALASAADAVTVTISGREQQ